MRENGTEGAGAPVPSFSVVTILHGYPFAASEKYEKYAFFQLPYKAAESIEKPKILC